MKRSLEKSTPVFGLLPYRCRRRILSSRMVGISIISPLGPLFAVHKISSGTRHVNPREKSTVRRIGHPRNPLDTAENCLSWQLCIMDADHDGGFQLSTGAYRHRHHIIDGDGPVLCGIGIVSQNRGQRKRESGIRD